MPPGEQPPPTSSQVTSYPPSSAEAAAAAEGAANAAMAAAAASDPSYGDDSVPNQERSFSSKRQKKKSGSWWSAAKETLSNPIHLAVILWTILAIPPCVIIGLNLIGVLKKIIPDEETRRKWVEVCTQIVNALFALMGLVFLPILTRQTFLLLRWLQRDRVELRQFYCRNGKRKPHDRTHIFIVVIMGLVASIATVAVSVIDWIYTTTTRPFWLTWITFAVSWVAPLIAFLYLLLSPLSRDYDIVKEGDEQMVRMYERRAASVVSVPAGEVPEWDGTVCPGCCEDGHVACCTLIFPCCMFGYNMERLGFGNRIVHALAFLIVLLGPILVFELSSYRLRDMGATERVIYYSGVALALLSLSYGGVWRSKMRSTYGLPASRWACCSARLTDMCTWIWCSYCALCQEIRTVDRYAMDVSVPGGRSMRADGSAVVVDVDMEEDEESVAHVPPVPMAPMKA